MVAAKQKDTQKRAPRTRSRASKAASADTPARDGAPGGSSRGWTFLTNHAHALLCLAQGESLTTRELSLRIGITERSVQAVLADLIADGYLEKSKIGRRNTYRVNPEGRLRHPLEAAHTVGDLIEALT